MEYSPPRSRVAVHAALALLVFSGLTSLALVAWFARASEPWSWKALIAIFSVLLGATTGTLVWRTPSRTHVVAGMLVMLLSLLRLGPPDEWNGTSLALLALTGLLLVPVVRAAVILRA